MSELTSSDQLPRLSRLIADGEFGQAIALATNLEKDALPLGRVGVMKAGALLGAGDLASAEAHFARIQSDAISDAVICWRNLAIIAFQSDRPDQAIEYIQRYRDWRRLDWEGVSLHASILVDQKKISEARAILEEYLEVFPRDRRAQVMRVETFTREYHWLEALLANQQVIAIHGLDLALLETMLDCYIGLGFREVAESLALTFRSMGDRVSRDSYATLGTLNYVLEHYPEAIDDLNYSKEADEVVADGVRLNLALALLADGRLEEGFEYYSHRKNVPQYFTIRIEGIPDWSGEPLEGKRVLVNFEQGIGDSIQFMRFLPSLAERGVRLVFNAQPELLKLLRFTQQPEAETVVDTHASSFDCQISLMDLARVCEIKSVDDIPADIPYLYASSEPLDYWRKRLSAYRGPKVGIAWAGSPGHPKDHVRSSSLWDLSPLLTIPGIQFFSLQLGRPREEIALWANELNVVDLGAEIADWADTAAVVEQMDLVISVDTSVAHLAGAMGKPLWLLLPALGNDWRWQLDETTSPWYPTATLFRQSVLGDWRELAMRVGASLAGHFCSHPDIQGTAFSEVLAWLQQAESASQLPSWMGKLDPKDVTWAARLLRHHCPPGISTESWSRLISLNPDAPCLLAQQAARASAEGREQGDEIWEKGKSSPDLGAWQWVDRGNDIESRLGLQACLECLNEGLLARPRHPLLMLEAGKRLILLGRSDEALVLLAEARELGHRPVETLATLGAEYLNRGRFAEAVECLRRALMMRPRHVGAWLSVAGIARRLNLPDLAVLVLQGVSTFSAMRSVGFALATNLAWSGQREAALPYLQDLDYAAMAGEELYACLQALMAMDLWDEAARLREYVIAHDVGHKNLRLLVSWRMLQQGGFEAGWKLYASAISARATAIPEWQGEALRDKRLLVYQDQGFGDLIQFLPLLDELVAQGAHIVFAVLPAMVELLELQNWPVKFIALDQVDWDSDTFDFQIAQMRLPARLTVDLTMPRHSNPILHVPVGVMPGWEASLSSDSRLKVGLAWAGNANYINDAMRSTCLMDWESLLAVEGVAWVCLQKDIASNQALGMPQFELINAIKDCDTWLKTAALVRQLDLVISVDTGVAHLAASLGVETWILLPPRVTDFRWGLERVDCPWYGNVSLYRRAVEESWPSVFAKVAESLRRKIAGLTIAD